MLIGLRGREPEDKIVMGPGQLSHLQPLLFRGGAGELTWPEEPVKTEIHSRLDDQTMRVAKRKTIQRGRESPEHLAGDRLPTGGRDDLALLDPPKGSFNCLH